jgi:hypothetical protein
MNGELLADVPTVHGEGTACTVGICIAFASSSRAVALHRIIAARRSPAHSA